MSDLALELRGVSKSFGEHKAVRGVNLRVSRGTIVGLVGPNGAGKSTLLHIVLGLAIPMAGEVRVFGSAPSDLADFGHRVGWVLESGGFHPAFTASRTFELLGSKLGIGPERQAEVITDVGLSESQHRRVGEFSTGMRQRLSLGAALLPRPDLLLLDEPMTGLDPSAIRWLRDILVRQRDRGCAVLVSSHLLDELARTADEVAVIDAGRLVTQRTLESLLHASGEAVRIRTTSPSDAKRALRAHGLSSEIAAGHFVVVDAPADVSIRALVAEGVEVHEVVTGGVSLEEAILDHLEQRESE